MILYNASLAEKLTATRDFGMLILNSLYLSNSQGKKISMPVCFGKDIRWNDSIQTDLWKNHSLKQGKRLHDIVRSFLKSIVKTPGFYWFKLHHFPTDPFHRKNMNDDIKSPRSSCTNLNEWSNYRFNFHRKVLHVTQICSWKIGKEYLEHKTRSETDGKIVSQTKRNVHDIDFNIQFQVLRGQVVNWTHTR